MSAVRTPIGKFGRTLKDFPATKLGALVIREALNRAPAMKESDVYEVIMGNVISAGLGQNPSSPGVDFCWVSCHYRGHDGKQGLWLGIESDHVCRTGN